MSRTRTAGCILRLECVGDSGRLVVGIVVEPSIAVVMPIVVAELVARDIDLWQGALDIAVAMRHILVDQTFPGQIRVYQDECLRMVSGVLEAMKHLNHDYADACVHETDVEKYNSIRPRDHSD